jgi:hypothetical protein
MFGGERPPEPTPGLYDDERVRGLEVAASQSNDVTVVDVLSMESAVAAVDTGEGQVGVMPAFDDAGVTGEVVSTEELELYC